MNDWNRDVTNERWQNDNRNTLNAPQFGQQSAEFDAMPEKRKPVHLRFGRSYVVHGNIVSNNLVWARENHHVALQ